MRLFSPSVMLLILIFSGPVQSNTFSPEFSGFSLSFIESSNSNYEHDTVALRAHFNATSWQFKGWNLHWALEPNINWYELHET